MGGLGGQFTEVYIWLGCEMWFGITTKRPRRWLRKGKLPSSPATDSQDRQYLKKGPCNDLTSPKTVHKKRAQWTISSPSMAVHLGIIAVHFHKQSSASVTQASAHSVQDPFQRQSRPINHSRHFRPCLQRTLQHRSRFLVTPMVVSLGRSRKWEERSQTLPEVFVCSVNSLAQLVHLR